MPIAMRDRCRRWLLPSPAGFSGPPLRARGLARPGSPTAPGLVTRKFGRRREGPASPLFGWRQPPPAGGGWCGREQSSRRDQGKRAARFGYDAPWVRSRGISHPRAAYGGEEQIAVCVAGLLSIAGTPPPGDSPGFAPLRCGRPSPCFPEATPNGLPYTHVRGRTRPGLAGFSLRRRKRARTGAPKYVGKGSPLSARSSHLPVGRERERNKRGEGDKSKNQR